MDNNKKKVKRFICQYCHGGFTRKDSLNRHQKNDCRIIKSIHSHLDGSHQSIQSEEEQEPTKTQEMQERQFIESDRPHWASDIEQEVTQLKKELAELKHKPSNVFNNNLQVVCVSNNDNYLDMLTEELDFERALEFIKGCALSSLSGDCRLIERIYLNPNNESTFRYVDKNRTKIEYYDESEEKIIDHRGLSLGRKLANNLQKSYLKGVNYLINRNLDNNLCPNKFLEEYDLQTWNRHIYELSDSKYQRKIINQLDIPNQ